MHIHLCTFQVHEYLPNQVKKHFPASPDSSWACWAVPSKSLLQVLVNVPGGTEQVLWLFLCNLSITSIWHVVELSLETCFHANNHQVQEEKTYNSLFPLNLGGYHAPKPEELRPMQNPSWTSEMNWVPSTIAICTCDKLMGQTLVKLSVSVKRQWAQDFQTSAILGLPLGKKNRFLFF